MTHYHYVNAPCGAGKTTSLINFYKDRIARTDSRLVIAQPTIDLMKATAERFREALGVEATLVYSPSRNEPAAPKFKAALENRDVKLILVTHATLIANPNFKKANADNTYLIIDEIPSIEEAMDVQLNTYKDILASNLDVVPSKVSSYFRLVRNQESEMFDTIRTDLNDQVVKSFEEIFDAVNNPHRDAFVSTDAWDKFVDTELKSYQLTVHLVLLPTLFFRWTNVIIMGANFLDSMLYKAWSTFDDVTFSEWEHSKDLPSIHSEETGTRATIYYCIEQIWSKSIEEKYGVLSIVSGEVAEHFSDRPFIYAVNNSTDVTTIAPLMASGIEAPVISHGINAYRHIHNAVFTPALNDTPQHLSFIAQYFGIEKGVISESKSFETAYQFVMRTSLRMPDETAPVEVVVMDERTAVFLASKLPGATVEAFGSIGEGMSLVTASEPVIRALTPAERKAKSRRIAKEVKTISDALSPSTGMITYAEYESVKSKKADNVHTVSMDDFSATMKAYSEQYLRYKADGKMLQGSGVRSGTDFKTNLILLDIDDSSMHPSHIKKALPGIASMVVNSHSNGRDGLNRYRVMIPLASYVGDEVVRYIVKHFVNKVNAYGEANDIEHTGIDKTTPLGVYYMPVQPVSKDDEYSVFITNNWNAGSMLDPIQFIEPMVTSNVNQEYEDMRMLELAKETAATKASLSSDEIDAKAAEALEKYATKQSGKGNAAFNQFAWSMAGKGIPLDMVEAYLNQNVDLFGSVRQDRINQIPNIMKTIRNKKV